MQSAVSPGLRPGAGGPDPVDPTVVFEVLGNERSRAILGAVGREALTASEIAETVTIPISTVYRHLETLTEAGLLEESIRIDPRGRNRKEYARDVNSLSVRLGGDFAITLE